MIMKRESSDAGTPGDLPDITAVLFRRASLIAGVTLLALLLAGGLLLAMGNVYRSESKLLVRVGRESVALDPTATTGQMVSLALNRVNEINSEIEILTGKRLAGRVVTTFGPEVILPPRDERFRRFLDPVKSWVGADPAADPAGDHARAVETLLKNLEVRAVKDSNIISVAYESPDPHHARDLLDKLLAFYLEEHINAYRTAGSHQFFARESESLHARLARTEEEQRELKDQMGIVSLEAEREAVSRQSTELSAEVSRNGTAQAAARARLAVLEIQLAECPAMVLSQETTGVAGTAGELMRQKLYELQVEEQSLLANYLPDSVPVKRIRQQVYEARRLLEDERASQKEVRREANVVRREVELKLLAEQDHLASLEGEGRSLAAKVDEVNGQLRKLNAATVLLAQLDRRQAFEKDMLESYVDKAEQARIYQELEAQRISNISVIQPATLPDRPARPRKSLILVLAALLGLAGGVSLAFLRDRMDRSFHDPQDIERLLNLPVLASVPRSRRPVVLPKRSAPARPYGEERPDEAAETPAGGADAARTTSRSRAVAGDGRRGARCRPSAYDQILDEIMILRGAGETASFGVAGASGREGASTVATNLALRLAGRGEGPGLLVDCHLEHPVIHKLLGLRCSPGLSEMGGRQDADPAIVATPVPHLDALTAGSCDGLPPMNRRLKTALGALARKPYRFVVLDLPPVCGAGSALRDAALLDGMLLVVESGRSRPENGERARRLLETVGARLLGVVLNKQRPAVPRWLCSQP